MSEMIPIEEAWTRIASRLYNLESETVDLSEAYGRVLRKPAVADIDQPAFDRAAMDGYAVPSGEPVLFRVVGEIQPGDVLSITPGEGECVRVFTGSRLPPNVDRVIPQENVLLHEGSICMVKKDSSRHIRRRGEDAEKGEVLLKTGTRLGTSDVSILAGCGVVQPLVSRKVRVAHVATGNELIPASRLPVGSEIRDTNTPLIAALVAETGADLVFHARLRDDPKSVQQIIKKLRNIDMDVLLISGGAGKGTHDNGAAILRELEFEIEFDQVNLRPGKPLTFGAQAGGCAFVIPGNPVSHFVVWHMVIRRLLVGLEGGRVVPETTSCRLAEDFEFRPDARETWWPSKVYWGVEDLLAKPLEWKSSGHLSALAGVNALVRIESKAQTIAKGTLLRTLPLGPIPSRLR